jgi:hypothetical protein
MMNYENLGESWKMELWIKTIWLWKLLGAKQSFGDVLGVFVES